MLASDVLAVTSVARELAREVIDPPGARALWPVATVARLAAIGWLPPRIREAYGFSWDLDDAGTLMAWCRRIRTARRLVPDGWPDGPWRESEQTARNHCASPALATVYDLASRH